MTDEVPFWAVLYSGLAVFHSRNANQHVAPVVIVLVTGGRTYWDWYTVDLVLDLIGPRRVVHGCAAGTDQLAQNWADKRFVASTGYPIRRPDEDGFQRNARMLRDGFPIDLVVAFPGGSGTADMIRRARKAGIYVIEVK